MRKLNFRQFRRMSTIRHPLCECHAIIQCQDVGINCSRCFGNNDDNAETSCCVCCVDVFFLFFACVIIYECETECSFIYLITLHCIPLMAEALKCE